MKRMNKLKAGIAACLALALNTSEARGETIKEFLDDFHANPARMMEKLPSEITKSGKVKSRGFINGKRVESVLRERNRLRGQVMTNAVDAFPDFHTIDILDSRAKDDNPETLVEPGSLIANIREMESRGLAQSALEPSPWSDSYWPVYKGVAGHRYADPGFPNSKAWNENHYYVQTNPASSIVSSGNPGMIDRLSPAEKYDFAIGDSSFSLTRWVWRRGQISFEQHGKVASWLGFCHGWAATSHMMTPIPAAPITVSNPNGIPVTFYPQDIKALNALLWGNAPPKTRFVGNRCNTSRPPKNQYGRVLDPGCFDTNPATWHIALVNQMGVHGRSFIMDSTFDYEVWNFPLASYKYRFFNPLTRQDVASLRNAAIPLQSYKSDPFKEFRSPRTKFILGIYMDVTHVNAINPTRRANTANAYKTIRLVYDLELDESYNIVGGEWYSNAHPDFIWSFEKGAQAMAIEDANLRREGWTSAFPVPNSWGSSAANASARGEPLASFILGLVPRAETPEEGEALARHLKMPRIMPE